MNYEYILNELIRLLDQLKPSGLNMKTDVFKIGDIGTNSVREIKDTNLVNTKVSLLLVTDDGLKSLRKVSPSNEKAHSSLLRLGKYLSEYILL